MASDIFSQDFKYGNLDFFVAKQPTKAPSYNRYEVIIYFPDGTLFIREVLRRPIEHPDQLLSAAYTALLEDLAMPVLDPQGYLREGHQRDVEFRQAGGEFAQGELSTWQQAKDLLDKLFEDPKRVELVLAAEREMRPHYMALEPQFKGPEAFLVQDITKLLKQAHMTPPGKEWDPHFKKPKPSPKPKKGKKS